MYNQYMVEIYLPPEMTQEFMNLIPSQRAQVNSLVKEGTIRSYTLSMDRQRLWVVMVEENESTLVDRLNTFPIMPYCEYEIHSLMFHDMASQELPRISLN
ncbi:MAG: muconolactone Delta-isomerase family protein [Bacteroidota bacterium]